MVELVEFQARSAPVFVDPSAVALVEHSDVERGEPWCEITMKDGSAVVVHGVVGAVAERINEARRKASC